jgi:hypothetical protein
MRRARDRDHGVKPYVAGNAWAYGRPVICAELGRASAIADAITATNVVW